MGWTEGEQKQPLQGAAASPGIWEKSEQGEHRGYEGEIQTLKDMSGLW